MDMPKKLKVAVIVLSTALLVSVGALAWTLWQNYWWQRSVDLVAHEAGASWAMSSFRRGHLALWEINPTNDFPRFSGRREGPFEIWLDEYRTGLPAPLHYAERKKIEAHNRQMRHMYEHPERFTPGKDERKHAQANGAANRNQPIRSETNRTSVAAGSDR
jgi:hypothetical protein